MKTEMEAGLNKQANRMDTKSLKKEGKNIIKKGRTWRIWNAEKV